jgi:SAM-dependent methyltransferase
MDPAEYRTLAAVEQEHWWFCSLHRRVLALLRQEARHQGRSLRIFDAGCGAGGLLLRLQGQPWLAAAEGCDRSPLALELARAHGLAVQIHSVNELADWPRCYDVVLSMDVLYHREVNPPRALAGMAGLLKPGGLLLLNVAALPCLERRHDRRTMGARRFRPAELRRLADAAALEVLDLRYWNSWLAPLLWLQARLERWFPPNPPLAGPEGSDLRPLPRWLNRSLEMLLAAEARLDRSLPMPFGSSLFLVARRR